MRVVAGALLLLGSTLGVAAGQGTPAEQYREFLEAYNAASGEFRRAETDEQRKAAVEHLDTFPQKFLDLADEHPDDPVALQALRQAVQAVDSVDSLAQNAWEINHRAFPAGSKPGEAARAVELLTRDHLRSDQLGPACERMRYAARTEYERFLAAVVRSNPNREVQAFAHLALAEVLYNQLQMLDLAADRPQLREQYASVFGKDFLAALERQSRATLARRAEERFEQAGRYDVELPFGGTVAEKAKAALHELRHLSVGKTAPEIEGRDQDGRQFKLSDYRGKVVLLYFWMEY